MVVVAYKAMLQEASKELSDSIVITGNIDESSPAPRLAVANNERRLLVTMTAHTALQIHPANAPREGPSCCQQYKVDNDEGS